MTTTPAERTAPAAGGTAVGTDPRAPRRRRAAALVGLVTWEPCGAPLAADLGDQQ